MQHCLRVFIYPISLHSQPGKMDIWMQGFKDWQLKEYEPRTFIKLYKQTRF